MILPIINWTVRNILQWSQVTATHLKISSMGAWSFNELQRFYSWLHHDDIITWKHALLALCEGNPPVTSGFPSQRACNTALWWQGTMPGPPAMAVAWWCHQMETSSALLALCEGNQLVTSGCHHKSHWCRALMFPLIWAWRNNWANIRDADDLRCHRAHYDITVIGWHALLTIS